MTQDPPNPDSPPSEPSADQALRALVVAFPETEYRHLRRYAEFKQDGQPDEAADALMGFLAVTSTWDLRKQRQAAVRIADVAEQTGSGPGSVVMPSRLWNDLVEPTLRQWAEQDLVALPHRLLALLEYPSYLHLRRAHELDPDDEAVTRRLAATLIRDVNFSASQLEKVELAKLAEAEDLVAALPDDEETRSLAADLDDLRQRITLAPDSAPHPYRTD